MEYLRNERFSSLTRNEKGTVRWNGRTWPKSYQCRPVEDYASPQAFKGGDVLMTCGHRAKLAHRFCPYCGRLITGTDLPHLRLAFKIARKGQPD